MLCWTRVNLEERQHTPCCWSAVQHLVHEVLHGFLKDVNPFLSLKLGRNNGILLRVASSQLWEYLLVAQCLRLRRLSQGHFGQLVTEHRTLCFC